MMLFNHIKNFLRLCKIAMQAIRLPKVKLEFTQSSDVPDMHEIFSHFTKPHPRFKIIRNKSVGMALVDLSEFSNRQAYISSISRKDQGAYHGKRALRRGFTFHEIDRNAYIDDIHAINTSTTERQGRPMDPAYFEKPSFYEKRPNFRYFGVLDPDGVLVAYCNIATYGNFSATDQLLGHKNNDGTMYLLLVEIICRLIDDREVQYFMYDTFLGAQDGLRNFKRRLGFQPYRVHYSLTHVLCPQS
jgi:hypothetical protein